MRHARALLSDISLNPIARVIYACLLFAGSVGGLMLVSFADSYLHAGVAWGRDTPPVPLADVNPMGVNLFLEKEVEPGKVVQTLDMARDGGFKWIRQGFAWNDIEISAKGDYTDTRNPGKVVSAWDKYDFIVDQAVGHGMTIMARLDSPPVWARMPGDDLEKYHKGPPNNPDDYGDFAEAVATRYKGKIKYYQVWNEPNLLGEWGGHPVSAEEYVKLLKVAHDRIKAVDPEAVIISAALAPTTEDSAANRNDILYLQDMYWAGGAPYFDVMSTMLYGLGQPPGDRRMDFKRLSFSRAVLLRDVMVANDDADTPIWISEYAWVSIPLDLQQRLNLSPDEWKVFQDKNIWGHNIQVDEETQGKYEVEGYQRARNEWPWMGVMFVWYLRNPDADPLEPATYFSLLQQDFTPRPAYFALQEYGKVVPPAPTPRDRPILATAGFLLLYSGFGLLSLASFAYVGTGVAGWARAALDLPQGRYSPQAREEALNGAAVVGMVALFMLYYAANDIRIIAATLAGYVAIAIFKPQVALALVAFSIPFFWYPKQYGSQELQVAESLIFLAFAALIARRALAFFLPNLWESLAASTPETTLPAQTSANGSEPTFPQDSAREIQGSRSGNVVGAGHAQPSAIGRDMRATRPIRILHEPPDLKLAESELESAQWPARPRQLIADLAKPIVVDWPGEGGRWTKDGGRRTVDDGRWADGARGQKAETPQLGQFISLESAIERLRAWTRQDAFALPAAILLALGAISLWTLVNQQFAPESARTYRWVIIEPVLLYFLLTDIITSKRGLMRVLDFFVAAGVFVALLGLWQFVGSSNTLNVEGVSRVLGVYRHPNNLALYLDRVAPFAACVALFLPWGWRKALYGLACLPLFATFLLTYSRGAWVAVAVAVVLAITIGLRWPLGWAHARTTRLFRRWLLAVAVAGIGAGMAAAILFPSLPDRIFNPSSGLKRIDIWVSALKMGRDHPFFGIGLDQFLNRYQAKDPYGQWLYIQPQQEAELFTSHPHNIVLDWWLSLGIMGLFVLAWLLWRYYREAIMLAKWTAQKGASDSLLRALAVGLVASMTAFLVHGMVDNSYFLMDLALIFWLSCGALQLSRMLYKSDPYQL
ncbi:MAG: O-antigen ligase family protein [Chloroflexia bacterium]